MSSLQCAARILETPSLGKSPDAQIVAQDVQEIDELATKLLLDNTYAVSSVASAPAAVRSAARAVLAPQ